MKSRNIAVPNVKGHPSCASFLYFIASKLIVFAFNLCHMDEKAT